MVSWGVDPSNQAVWILFELHGKPFGLINIYASNDAHDRWSLWSWLAFSLPLAAWVLCGDFNMVEKFVDKQSHNPFRWNLGEREAWFFLKNKLSLYDPNSTFSPSNFQESHWFTWSNLQAGNNRILKRLDRAMLLESDSFCFENLISQYPPVYVVSDTTLSDHAPIVFNIKYNHIPERIFKPQRYMNTSLLPCPSMKEHIFCIWNIIPRPLGVTGWITWWNNAISRTTKVLRTIGIEFAKRRRKSNLVIRTEFARASRSLEVDPFNITLQANVLEMD